MTKEKYKFRLNEGHYDQRMTQRRIIALSGPKGVGKSSLALYLCTRQSFVCIPFARPIKRMLRELLLCQNVDEDEITAMLEGNLKEISTPYLCGKTPRYAMQTLGTEWREMISTKLWLNTWDFACAKYPRIVVDDMRFSHEADHIIDRGGLIVRINRPGFSASVEHVSEQEFLNIVPHLVLNNSGSLNELYDSLILNGARS